MRTLLAESDRWSRKYGTPDTAGKLGVGGQDIALDAEIGAVSSGDGHAVDEALTHDQTIDTAGGGRTDPLDNIDCRAPDLARYD